jgi:hypothetical protein
MIRHTQRKDRVTGKAHLMRSVPSTLSRPSPPVISSFGAHGSLPLRGNPGLSVASFVSRSESTLHTPEEAVISTDDSSPPPLLPSISTSGSVTSDETEYSKFYNNTTATHFLSAQHRIEVFQDSYRASCSSEPLHQDHLSAPFSPYSQTSIFQIVSTGNPPLNPSPISVGYPTPGENWHQQHQDTLPGYCVRFETYLSSDWPESEQTVVVPDEPISSPPGLEVDNISENHSSPEPQIQGTAFSPSPHDDRSTDPRALQEISRWPAVCFQCSSSSKDYPVPDTMYETFSTWLVHNWTAHAEVGAWSPMRCPWEDPPCGNPKYFKTQKHWLDHVSIVHQKTLYCNRANCKQGKGAPEETAFGTRADLKRHDQSIHETPIYCRKQCCKGRKGAKLNRKDKRDIHESKYHGPFSCSFNGCPRRRINGIDYGFSDQNLLNAHMRHTHHQSRTYIESDDRETTVFSNNLSLNE